MMLLNILAVVVIILAVVYRKLTSDPQIAVAGYHLLNRFSDETDYNLHQNHYSTGPFAPARQEVSNIEAEIVSGALPSDVEGLFLRIGPNLIEEKLSHGYHWFDGDGMLHSIRIKDGKGLYSSQYVHTPNYLLSKQYKGPVWFQIGELRGIVGLLKILYIQFILSKVIDITPLTAGTANTAINYFNKRMFLGYESNFPFEIVWQENNTFSNKGYEDFSHILNYPFTAHPKRDPIDQNLYFNGYSVDGKYTMKYGKISINNQVENYFDIPITSPIFSHDMSITENYVVLYDTSIIFDKEAILKDGTFYKLETTKPLRIGLLPKTATNANSTKWFTFPQAYGIVHAFNAWEEPDTHEVVVVTPLYTAFRFSGHNTESEELLYQTAELRMNLVSGVTTVTNFTSQHDGEFPNVHPQYLGRKTRYGFAAGINRTLHQFDTIVKYDFQFKKGAGSISLPPHHVCGEPVIIARKMNPALTRKEKDRSDYVYLALFTVNLMTLESDWRLYDGQTMNDEPIVTLRVPGVKIPLGFHGLWIHEKDLQEHIAYQSKQSTIPY